MRRSFARHSIGQTNYGRSVGGNWFIIDSRMIF
jgi:hypothetical protein